MKFTLSTNPKGHTPVGKAFQELSAQFNTSNVVTKTHAAGVLSMEDIGGAEHASLNAAANSLDNVLSAMVTALGMEAKEITPGQRHSAVYAGLMAGDFAAAGKRELSFTRLSQEGYAVVAPGVSDSYNKSTLAQEAFNNVDNRTSMAYSVAYNFMSARQSEMTETFWPTIVIGPDQVGLEVNVNVLTVFNGSKHGITGVFEDFKRKNLIRALADSTILNKNETLAVPVYRAQSIGSFVPVATLPSYNVLVDDQSIPTAALAFGKKIDLIGISQTDALLATGESDQRDSLDPTVTMKNIYIQVGADLLKFTVRNLPYSNFTAATQNDNQIQNLNFATQSLLVNKDKKNVDGSALADLSSIVTGDLVVRFELRVGGSINIETGELNTFPAPLSIYSVATNDGTLLAPDDSRYVALQAKIDTAKALGFDIEAYRSNANRRQRGQLINTRRFTQLYNVPLRSPIAAERPAHKGAEEDAVDLQALLTATRFRIDNEAITAILDYSQTLSEYVDARDVNGVGPDVLGAGRYYVLPTYHKESLDLTNVVDSIKSSDRAMDIQAALVVKLRDVMARAYTDSQYKAASDALSGGTAGAPKVSLLTDPVIARYLLEPGELRTLGNDFELKVVSHLDYRIRGKIFMVFSAAGDTQNNEVNILNFGNLVWAPELVLAANLSRTGAYNKETQVQPRYLFITHCPIMVELDITGVQETLSKVPLAIRAIQPLDILDVTPVTP